MSKAQSTVDTIGTFKSIAAAHAGAVNSLVIITGHIETLRKAGVSIGKNKKSCKLRAQLIDAYTAAFPGKAEKTLANYITAVADAVNNGTEFSFSASKGKAAPSKDKNGDKDGAKKARPATGEEKMISALLNVWKLSDVGEDVLIQIESAMANDMPLIDAITYVLEANGENLDPGESAE